MSVLCVLIMGSLSAQTVSVDNTQNNQSPPVDQDNPQRTIIQNGNAEIVGSLGIGNDIGTPNYGFDTFILRENNLRIYFDDTSVGTFPSNDWRLTANSSTNGGDSYFSIDDATAGTIPFRIDAGAGNNGIRIESGGNVGIGIANPVVKLHVFDDDTPTVRLDQVGGFGTYRWDVAGNETNFFIRDVTTGSRLPFRIRPGAPTSSIDIASSGAVGIGTDSPNANASIHLGGNNKGLLLNRLSSAQRTTLGLSLTATEAGMVVFDTDSNIAYFWDGVQWEPVGTSTDDQVADVFQMNGNNLELSLEDDGVATQTVDLSQFLDNTDDQVADVFQMNGNNLELSLEDDGVATQTVDLSQFLDNTDDQVADVFQMNGNNLELSLEDDGVATQTVDLSQFLDNTDDQVADVFQMNGNNLELSLEDDGVATQTVDLSQFLDNTDDQQLSLAGNTLTLEDGGSVDLAPYLDNTDDQQLSLAGNTLTLEDGGNVNLAPFLDNTDDQQLTLVGNVLSLENGGSVSLFPFENTDNQLLGFALNGNDLVLSITNGNVVTIDLTPVIQPLIDENATQQTLIDDLIARVEALEDCACTLDNPDNDGRAFDGPLLFQNTPNPFKNTTSIGYYIPWEHKTAHITITTLLGQNLWKIPITQFGEGNLLIDRSQMASTTYLYTLYVDGKRIDTKRMLIE